MSLLLPAMLAAAMFAQAQSGTKLHAEGKYREAEAAFRAELAEAEQQHGTGHGETALLLNNLAIAIFASGRAAEAEPVVRRAISIWEQQDNGRSQLASALNNLGAFQAAQGNHASAETHYLRALSLVDPESAEAAPALTNLATIYAGRRDFVKAEELQRRAVAIRERKLSPDDPRVGTGYGALATVLQSAGRLEEAEGDLQP